MKKAILMLIVVLSILITACDVNTFHSSGACSKKCSMDGFNSGKCIRSSNTADSEDGTKIASCLIERKDGSGSCEKMDRCKCYCFD
ncbi:hypothetical protein ACFL0W_02560 [Nanoarchaeota archaeon]